GETRAINAVVVVAGIRRIDVDSRCKEVDGLFSIVGKRSDQVGISAAGGRGSDLKPVFCFLSPLIKSGGEAFIDVVVVPVVARRMYDEHAFRFGIPYGLVYHFFLG